MRLFPFLVLVLDGCSPDPPEVRATTPLEDTETGSPAATGPTDSAGAPDSATTEAEDCPYDGPVAITAVSVACDADNFVTFAVETQGVTGGWGYVFAMETANSPPWSEEHDLRTRELDDTCGAWERLEMRVETQSSAGDPGFYERNATSLFACGAHYGSDVMTYAFAILDADASVVDCWVAGIDPEGLAGGAYDPAMINIPSFDLRGCAVGVLGR